METALEINLLPKPKPPSYDLRDLVPSRKVLFAIRIAWRLNLLDARHKWIQLNDFRMRMQQFDRKLSRDIIRQWRDFGIHDSFRHDWIVR